jgi:hypothetical protein
MVASNPMKASWYPVLQWAARRGVRGFFSTVDLARSLDVTGLDRNEAEAIVKSRAHAVTQKLWKWGYLRKVAKSELPDVEKNSDEKRSRGRPVAIWTVTAKGSRRAKAPYKQKFFFDRES